MNFCLVYWSDSVFEKKDNSICDQRFFEKIKQLVAI
ncbi:hypothetical protein T4C_4684 [Trichinella pseudospiralis]|uniref:Uncharacterized protein n=1 Tax=Trichinella pseudospiralis TaxID=6337 RepID=A0A0V1I954_TRIPS|nr:hypothetical protein T4C_4684 [Trichinella pseudospiralis]